MKIFGISAAVGAFIAMLMAYANHKTELMIMEGFLMIAGCILTLHGSKGK